MSVEVKDGVIGGNVHTGDVHHHHYPQQNLVQTAVHHMYPQSPSGNLDVVSPSRQVWFLGKRIWNPQMGLIIISIICSVGLIWVIPVLPAIIGIAIATLAIKNGDIRGAMPLAVGILTLIISINTL